MRLRNVKLSTTPVIFSLILAALFFFVFNIAIISRMHDISHLETMKPGFIISLPVFFIAVFNILFLPLSMTRVGKPIFIILTLLSAMLSYATYSFGVIFSKEMLANIVETDTAEASSYLNMATFNWLLLLGVIPSVLIWKVKIAPSRRKFAYPIFSAVASILLIFAVAGLYYQDYVMTLRNYSDLKRIVVPTYAIASGYKFTKQRYFTSVSPHEEIGADAQQVVTNQKKKNLTILVVGETARADNYSMNGYEQDTNKYLNPLGVNFYNNVTSCGTETAVSVPCMFSNMTRAHYSEDKAQSQDNVLDILKRAKVQLLWIDNNGGCKGVCKNIESIDIRQEYAKDTEFCSSAGCLDGAFIPELRKRIDMLKNQNTLVILHLMGSHGPAYYKRYPATHAPFKPDCQRSDVQNCSPQALTNSYDNTILYTDYVLSEVVKVLQENERQWDVSMLYLSDHGESLGEKGVYLHGLPYSIAPKEQKHIPLITWFPASFMKNKKIDDACLQKNLGSEYSQDNLFHTLLGLMNVSTSVYNRQMDMFASCQNN